MKLYCLCLKYRYDSKNVSLFDLVVLNRTWCALELNTQQSKVRQYTGMKCQNRFDLR